jgi:hypothetical protein
MNRNFPEENIDTAYEKMFDLVGRGKCKVKPQ